MEPIIFEEEYEVRTPGRKHYKWELKTAGRDYWHITARHSGTDLTHDPRDVPGYYASYWNIRVTTSPLQPQYVIKFVMETQYDQGPEIGDIVHEIHTHIMSLYDAGLLCKDQDGHQTPK